MEFIATATTSNDHRSADFHVTSKCLEAGKVSKLKVHKFY